MATKGQFIIPSFQQGWAASFYQTEYVVGFAYNLSAQILYVIYPQQQFDVYLNANTTLAQGLSVANNQLGGSYLNPNLPTPDVIYKTQIEGQFPQCILCENGSNMQNPTYGSGSPLMTENGQYLVLT